MTHTCHPRHAHTHTHARARARVRTHTHTCTPQLYSPRGFGNGLPGRTARAPPCKRNRRRGGVRTGDRRHPVPPPPTPPRAPAPGRNSRACVAHRPGSAERGIFGIYIRRQKSKESRRVRRPAPCPRSPPVSCLRSSSGIPTRKAIPTRTATRKVTRISESRPGNPSRDPGMHPLARRHAG